MKIPVLTSFLSRLLAAFLLLSSAVWAQEEAPATNDKSAPASPSATAPDTPAAPAATPSEVAPTAPTEEPALRRLDAPTAPTADTPTAATEAVKETEGVPTPGPETQEKSAHDHHPHRRSHGGDERVGFGHNSVLGRGEHAQAVVSIFGSSTADGTVNDAVVSILGSSTTSSEVGGAVVSILGSSRVNDGSVGDATVSVLGSTYVNGIVHGDAVAVMGNVELGPKAEVFGEVVCIGGKIKRDPASVVHGQVNNVAFGTAFEGLGMGLEWLQAWVTQCAFLLRPLGFGPHLMWAWWVALAFLAFYVLLSLIFPRAVERCAATLEDRPGYSVLTAVLTVLIVPVVTVLLCVTIVGIAIVPFLGAALLFATLFGKAVMLAWLGRCITRHINRGTPIHAAVSTIVGGAIVLLLYTVPVLGLIVYKALGVLGLGVVIFTLIQGTKRRPIPAPVGAASSAGAFTGTVPPPVSSRTSSGFGSPTPDAAFAAMEPPGVQSMPPPLAPSAATLPRAGFWIRIAASAIDALIVALVVNLLPDAYSPNFLFAMAVYCGVLWALKGTTIGGIVCNLKVVRVDERPMDWPTALVRALAGFLSLVAAGLGFIWVAFDDQKQSWHDKIAGTTIVQVPRGVPLV